MADLWPMSQHLPVSTSPVRFAIGEPHGMTSNSWRIWTNDKGDTYVACRDNFNNVKVSLHASGRWRMAFTSEAVAKEPNLVSANGNRAWEVWGEPDQIRPGTVVALRLIFITSELRVAPNQRNGRKWRDTIFVNSRPTKGKLTVATLFLTHGNIEQRHEYEPTLHLASLPLPNGRRVQVTVHAEDENTFSKGLAKSGDEAIAQVSAHGVRPPEHGYLYFFGFQEDGARFIAGIRARDFE